MTGVTAYARPGSAVAPRWISGAAVLLGAAVALSGQALASTGQPARAVTWGSMSLAVYAASLLVLVGGGRGRLLGLGRWWFGSWILLWYGVAFGLASLTWVQAQTGNAAQISLSSVLRALWLVAVGMTLWVIGYLVGPGRPASRLGKRAVAALSLRCTPDVRSPLTPWILYGIGTAARVATAVTTGRFGYVGDVRSAVISASSYHQWLSFLSLFAPLAVAASALQVYRERIPGARVTMAVLALAEIVVGAVAGGKQSFIITILAVAIPFTATRRTMHKGLLAFAMIVFLLVVVPFNQAYRDAARNGPGTLSAGQAISAAPGILVQAVTTGDAAQVLWTSTSYMLARLREIDSPAIIIQRTPAQVAYQSPVQLIEAPAANLVPRALWPGKPVLDGGYQFGQVYYQVPANVFTSYAIPPVGDLYRHGGWIPVIVGMFLLGCAVRFLDEVVDVTANPHAVFLFLLLLPSLVKQENGWEGMLAGLPGTLLVWLVATCLTFRRRARRSPSHGQIGSTDSALNGGGSVPDRDP